MTPPSSRSGFPGESHGVPGKDEAAIPTDLAHASQAVTRLSPDASSIPFAEDTIPPLEVPAELQQHPRYRLLERVGAGGMGVVYKARHRFMDRIVALKVLRGSPLDVPEMAARFEREVRAAASLSHPHIVTAYDAESSGDLHFLVMEYVQGTNLAELIAQCGPLPVAQACTYARQAALGLEHAFRRGMVHRDIKPHNLILTDGAGPDDSGRLVKILDFGLARLVQETRSPERPVREAQADKSSNDLETMPGALMGTAAYMAPEQARCPSTADIRADIYSLGCTLYHFLTGQPPFPGGSLKERLEAHRVAVPQPLSCFRGDLPASLQGVLDRLLAKDPAQRYQTPAEVAEALAPFTVAQEEEPSRNHVQAKPRLPARHHLSLKAAGLVLTVLLACFSAAWIYSSFFAGQEGLPLADPLVVTVPGRLLQGHTGPVHALACSSDGKLLLSAGRDRMVRTWDLPSGEPRKLLRGHTDLVRCLALSADGKQALSASNDGTVRVWDVEEGSERLCFREHHKTVTSVVFSPDERHALSGGEDQRILLWEVASGKVVRRFEAAAECLAFSPDGSSFLCGWWDHQASLWQLTPGKVIQTFRAHEGGIKSVSFSPDGKLILLASEDRTLSLWDFSSGRLVRRWKAHNGFIWGAAFSGDGRRLLSAGWDHTARLWDAASGRELQRFAPDAEELLCVVFSADGKQGICGSADRTIRLWNLPP